MNRKQRRANAKAIRKSLRMEGKTKEDKIKELNDRYTRLAAAAGDTAYRVQIMNEQLDNLKYEMKQVQLEHASLAKPETEPGQKASEANATAAQLTEEGKQELVDAFKAAAEKQGDENVQAPSETPATANAG